MSKICHGHDLDRALLVVHQLVQQRIPIFRNTMFQLLQVCLKQRDLSKGMCLYSHMIILGLDSVSILTDYVIRLFAAFSYLPEARKVFSAVLKPSAYTWNTIISAHTDLGECDEAIALYQQMQQKGATPDRVTFLSVLKASSITGALAQVRLIHDRIDANKLECDVILGSCLVDVYSKCGSVEEARKVFDRMSKRNVVSWGAMMAGYNQHGYSLATLELFERMQLEGVEPNRAILLCILKACATIAAIKQGYTCHGHFDAVVRCFQAMQQEGVKPDHTLLTSVLTACSHIGLLKEGHRYFKGMRDEFGIIPTVEHYSCMVDLLGRAGCLYEAVGFIQSMLVQPDSILLTSLLTCCKTYGNVEVARFCFDELVVLDPNDASLYTLMASIYEEHEMWRAANQLQALKRSRGVFKKVGKACVEVNSKVHEFSVGNSSSSQYEFYGKLYSLTRSLLYKGYVPQVAVGLALVTDSQLADC